jgi:hypothetical protein
MSVILAISGGRDQECRSSKPALGKQFKRPYLEKNPSQKWADGLAQGVGPEFKPQYHKKRWISSHQPWQSVIVTLLALQLSPSEMYFWGWGSRTGVLN